MLPCSEVEYWRTASLETLPRGNRVALGFRRPESRWPSCLQNLSLAVIVLHEVQKVGFCPVCLGLEIRRAVFFAMG